MYCVWSTCTTVYSNNVYYSCHLLYLKWDVEKRQKACSFLHGFCDMNSFWTPFGRYRKLIINTCIPIDNLFSSHTFWTVWILLQSDYCYSPRLDISPILTMCGQCWSVLAKKGFVTPRITPGLKYRMTLLGHECTFPQQEPLLGVCNSHSKPMQWHRLSENGKPNLEVISEEIPAVLCNLPNNCHIRLTVEPHRF